MPPRRKNVEPRWRRRKNIHTESYRFVDFLQPKSLHLIVCLYFTLLIAIVLYWMLVRCIRSWHRCERRRKGLDSPLAALYPVYVMENHLHLLFYILVRLWTCGICIYIGKFPSVRPTSSRTKYIHYSRLQYAVPFNGHLQMVGQCGAISNAINSKVASEKLKPNVAWTK